MAYFRKFITCRKLAAFLAIGMLLRSIVAVGYMLDTNPTDGSFLSIIICEGPSGINAIAGLDVQNQHHGGHQSHNDPDDGNSDKHDHVTQEHPISSCNFWSSSSHSLLADLSFFDISTFLASDEVIFYRNHNANRLSNNTRFARAPPFPG